MYQLACDNVSVTYDIINKSTYESLYNHDIHYSNSTIYLLIRVNHRYKGDQTRIQGEIQKQKGPNVPNSAFSDVN